MFVVRAAFATRAVNALGLEIGSTLQPGKRQRHSDDSIAERVRQRAAKSQRRQNFLVTWMINNSEKVKLLVKKRICAPSSDKSFCQEKHPLMKNTKKFLRFVNDPILQTDLNAMESEASTIQQELSKLANVVPIGDKNISAGFKILSRMAKYLASNVRSVNLCMRL